MTPSNKNCAFTICAKNYLAQAVTLRNSFKKYNPNCDFYIYLADQKSNDVDIEISVLDGSCCPKWEEMAFKYNVIEFSTSIKPFVFKKLFNDGYEKVLYLDPDIYVTDSLKYIYELLDNKSIILTPHYNNIQKVYSGSVTEEELLFVGIYNLGFAGIKNNGIGNKIIDWWCDRLESKCYADHRDALHVDQRWMDFIPGFFPDDVHISHHAGINTAIWNLHERDLTIVDDKYFIRDMDSGELYPLLFFHFSGFDPDKAETINRRHPKYNTSVFPAFKPLIEEYASSVIANGYTKFHPLVYSFNSFSDGENIIPLHRRLFREYIKSASDFGNPFDIHGTFYSKLKKNRLLTGVHSADFNAGINANDRKQGAKIENVAKIFSRLFIRIFGIRRFYLLLRFAERFSRLEYQSYLIEDK